MLMPVSICIFDGCLRLANTSQPAKSVWLRGCSGPVYPQGFIQMRQNILAPSKEGILPVGNIPERHFASPNQSQLSCALLEKCGESFGIMKLGCCDASLPLPYHFRVGSANLLCHVFLRPVALFTFISQQLIGESTGSCFHLIHHLSIFLCTSIPCLNYNDITCPLYDVLTVAFFKHTTPC